MVVSCHGLLNQLTGNISYKWKYNWIPKHKLEFLSFIRWCQQWREIQYYSRLCGGQLKQSVGNTNNENYVQKFCGFLSDRFLIRFCFVFTSQFRFNRVHQVIIVSFRSNQFSLIPHRYVGLIESSIPLLLILFVANIFSPFSNLTHNRPPLIIRCTLRCIIHLHF